MYAQPLPTRNDPLLSPLLAAADAAAREVEIERLVVRFARPVVERIVARQGQGDANLRSADAEDVIGTVSLRLIVRLRSLVDDGDAIEDFERYVAGLTYNALHDILRSRFPERARLKTRLRYILTHDPRLALWYRASGPVTGLAEWSGHPAADSVVHLHPASVSAAMRNSRRTADALAAIFQALRHPLTLDALVRLAGELWNIADVVVATDAGSVADTQPQALQTVQSRQFLRTLWREIRELRPMQRTALLLNLRDNETVNVVSLLVVTATATFAELAEAIGMSETELTAIWNDLPLDDLRIAAILGLTRQQVINLRKSARERLARRALWARR